MTLTEARNALRKEAERLRQRAEEVRHDVVRHLLICAANRYDSAAAAALSAEHTALQATRYEAEPGGGADAL